MSDRNDELRPEYDMTKFLKEGVKGKHAEEFRKGTNLVLLEPDVFEIFPTAESVNEALRLVIRMIELPENAKKSKSALGQDD